MTNVHPGWATAKNSFRVGEPNPVQNAGFIEINWKEKSIELSVINEAGEKVMRHPTKFSELEFK